MNLENNQNVYLMIAAGFLLEVAGIALPFLMIMKIIESTLLLNLFSYAISVSGLLLGFIGGVLYVKGYRAR